MKRKAQVNPLIASPEAEQSVLGAILLRPAVIPEVMAILSPRDFSREAHQKIYQTMLDLAERQAPVDLVSVNNLLKERGQLEEVGGSLFLSGLSEQVGIAANAGYYARLVQEKAVVRNIRLKAHEIAQACQPGVSAAEILQFAESSIFEITSRVACEDQLIPAEALLKKDFTKEEDIIANGILPKGGGMILAGESGEGKSLIRLELAIHLAMGWDLWNLDIPQARRVLIIQFENTEKIEAYRLKRMLSGLEINDCAGRLIFSSPITRFDLGQQKDQSRLARIIEKSGAEVVIYDPLTSLHRINENDNVQMREVLDNVTEINRQTGAAAILIHHFGKPTGESATAHRTRGASSIRDWADTLLGLSRKKNDDRILRVLEFVKVRNGPEPKPFVLERSKETFLHTLANDDDVCPPEKVRLILERLGGRVESQDRLQQAIVEQTNCKERRARHFIAQAISRGAIICEPNREDARKKVYRCPENSGTEG